MIIRMKISCLLLLRGVSHLEVELSWISWSVNVNEVPWLDKKIMHNMLNDEPAWPGQCGLSSSSTPGVSFVHRDVCMCLCKYGISHVPRHQPPRTYAVIKSERCWRRRIFPFSAFWFLHAARVNVTSPA